MGILWQEGCLDRSLKVKGVTTRAIEADIIHTILVNVTREVANGAGVHIFSGFSVGCFMIAGVSVTTITNTAVHQIVCYRPIEEETIGSDWFTGEGVYCIDLSQGRIDASQVIILVGNECLRS